MPQIPKRTGKVAGPPAAPAAPAAATPAPTQAHVFVTYGGPVDPRDRSTAVTVPHPDPHPDEHFPLGQKVRTTRSTADRLAAMAGHTFTTDPAQPEGDE